MLHTPVWDRLPGVYGCNVFVNNNATRGAWMLAGGVDALVISPTPWVEDNSTAPFQAWSQQMNDITQILFGSSALPGRSGAGQGGATAA